MPVETASVDPDETARYEPFHLDLHRVCRDVWFLVYIAETVYLSYLS